METTYDFRSKSVSTKVTEEQFAKYTEAAGGRSLSEWVREVLDAHVDRAPFEQALMEQIWWLRYVLVNGLPHTAPNPHAAAEEIHKLVAEAEHKKTAKAAAILRGTK